MRDWLDRSLLILPTGLAARRPSGCLSKTSEKVPAAARQVRRRLTREHEDAATHSGECTYTAPVPC